VSLASLRLCAPPATSPSPPTSGAEPVAAEPLDKLEPRADVDRALLAALARDGRASYTELATQVGLSVSAVHQRVRRLEQRGVITGYSARVEAKAVGLPMVAFVSITPIDVAQPDDAPARLAHLTAIEACHSVAGPDSYMLKVRVASPDALEGLLAEIRAAANVTTRTTVVLTTFYEDRPPV
jgi:Lrp/AsnC family leucine-responsive transcriptional regulator